MAVTRVVAVEDDGTVWEAVPRAGQVRNGRDACRMTVGVPPGVDGADAYRRIVWAER